MSKIKVLFICHGRREGLPKAAKQSCAERGIVRHSTAVIVPRNYQKTTSWAN